MAPVTVNGQGPFALVLDTAASGTTLDAETIASLALLRDAASEPGALTAMLNWYRASPLYEHGVRCPHCADEYTEADRARFRERQRQMDLADARGQRHFAD